MRVFRDFIIVKVPSVFIDETRYKGLDGKAILTDVFHNPAHHVRDFGIVEATPEFLSSFPIVQDAPSLPAYTDGDPTFASRYRRMGDIPLEVRPGDKVYFHYNCLLPDVHHARYNHQFLTSRKETVKGEVVSMLYFKVKYDLIFGAVRYVKTSGVMKDFSWDMEADLKPFKSIINPEGDQPLVREDRFVHGDNVYRKEVQMIGSYALVEPDMETWEEISIPIPQTGANGKVLVDGQGKPMMKPKEQWLVTKSQPGERYLQGWIRNIGTPLNGDPLEFEEGDYVHFRPYANTKLTFEGKEYFRMRQRYIHARRVRKAS